MPVLVWLWTTVSYPRSRSILTERMELDAHLHMCTHMHTLTPPQLLAPHGDSRKTRKHKRGTAELKQMFANETTRNQKKEEVRKEAGLGPGWAEGGGRELGGLHRVSTINPVTHRRVGPHCNQAAEFSRSLPSARGDGRQHRLLSAASSFSGPPPPRRPLSGGEGLGCGEIKHTPPLPQDWYRERRAAQRGEQKGSSTPLLPASLGSPRTRRAGC